MGCVGTGGEQDLWMQEEEEEEEEEEGGRGGGCFQQSHFSVLPRREIGRLVLLVLVDE